MATQTFYRLGIWLPLAVPALVAGLVHGLCIRRARDVASPDNLHRARDCHGELSLLRHFNGPNQGCIERHGCGWRRVQKCWRDRPVLRAIS
jgi:hypothetical protein